MRVLILTERIVVLFRKCLLSIVVLLTSAIRYSHCSLILLKLTKAHDIFSIYADSEIIFSRSLSRVPFLSQLTNSKRESDQSSRRHRAAIHFRPRRASFYETEGRPNSVAMRSDRRDFGVCAKLARYTSVTNLFPEDKTISVA